jgi:1-acyl-sn-glycerol-3-phosphate acyltransferase
MSALYVPMSWLLRLLVAIHFRCVRVRHARRFPRFGPALLVANHPSTWTDVLLLDVALGRRLHFLARHQLFRPAPRRWILRLFGSLPVAQSHDGPDHAKFNAATFRRCCELLARGEVVAVFPEGMSGDDRSVRSFHTGAARIALDRIEAGGTIPVVPVGIYYVDRTAFREGVVLTVGEPLVLSPSSAPAPDARDPWLENVTGHLQDAVAGLIAVRPGHVPRGAVEHLTARASTAMRGTFAVLLAPLGIAGLLLNAPPVVATRLCVLGFNDPSRVALARILGSLGLFLAWYAAVAMLPLAGSRPWWTGVALVAAAIALGAITLVWLDALRAWRGRLAPRGRAARRAGT